jgi:hypothetical protein
MDGSIYIHLFLEKVKAALKSGIVASVVGGFVQARGSVISGRIVASRKPSDVVGCHQVRRRYVHRPIVGQA